MTDVLLAIDQGTTSSRAIAFDASGRIHGLAQREFPQHFPKLGWVEHSPDDLWRTTLTVCQEVLAKIEGQDGLSVVAAGITNQRETTLVWDRRTGKAIYPAIVWQDRRTAEQCAALKHGGAEAMVAAKTGLLLDPYFSATKLAWMLDNVDGARRAAEAGHLAFGTVDTYLIWQLTHGSVHATDATNASRTMLFNIHEQQWDLELLDLFGVPASLLPQVKDSADDYGTTADGLFPVRLPIAGVAGDQQAAAIGQACFQPGLIKSTYGTGCFVVMNTGTRAVASKNRLLTTVAYRLNGEVTYALEGSIFVAGAAVQWLRDGLGIITEASETQALAEQLPDNEGVYLVPAFTGLGAPHWDPDARGAVFGLTRDTGPAHFARAALESVCYQTRDLIEAMNRDRDAPVTALRVDGGMVRNDWLLQFLADVLDTKVQRPTVVETTALGAAYLAGLQIGLFDSLDEIARQWQQDISFTPMMAGHERERLIQGWDNAVSKVLTRKP